ncbi:hypothetical protein Tco_0688513 [Tanacetum coccineum]
MQRVNHLNKFVPTTVLTRTGIFPVSIARQNFSSQAVSTNTARKVNTARPIVNDVRPRNVFHKTHSPNKRHMTGNKAYLAEYQDYNGGLVAFGGSKG